MPDIVEGVAGGGALGEEAKIILYLVLFWLATGPLQTGGLEKPFEVAPMGHSAPYTLRRSFIFG